MRSSILVLGLVVGEVVAGCGFHSPLGATADSGAGSDSGSDGGCTSFAMLVNTCQLSFDAELTLTGSSKYDTDSHLLMINGTATPIARKTVMIGNDEVDVISAHNVQLAASAGTILHATGRRGLVIVASNDVTIGVDAQIDVSNGGAGARTSCPGGATKGEDNSNGAGGGGGGGYGADGGTGGAGNAGSSPSQGGSKGMLESSFTGFHGGCPGANGGSGHTTGGTGGKGGGALYVVAGNHIVLLGASPLNAGGGGGKGGGGNSGGDAGGGGGGSGGLLILQAPHIMGAIATIAANGGSGGGGSSNQGPGTDGNAGSVNSARATGGGGAATASAGGDGGSVLGPAGDSVTANASGGGGGGGGGVGIIRILSTDSPLLTTSPSPTN